MRWFPLVIATSIGCAPAALPDPEVEAVDPRRGWNGEDTLVTIEGAHFYPQIEVDARRVGSADLDRDFTAWLVGPGGSEDRHLLSGVSVQDYEHLRAVVDRGLPSGLYAVEVEGPTGRVGRADDAFTVSDTRADRLAIEASCQSCEVGQTTTVDILLMAPDDEQVFADLEVALVVSGSEQPANVIFTDLSALDDGTLLPDGDGVRGFLGENGVASVSFEVLTPDELTVTASSFDPTSGITSDSETLVFLPGSEWSAVVELPSPDFEAVAGESFDVVLSRVDLLGNVLEEAAFLTLKSRCGSLFEQVEVAGETVVPVTLARATGSGTRSCEDEELAVLDGNTLEVGSSLPFAVLPGPTTRFDVDLSFVQLRAGDVEPVLAYPKDAFGNRTAWAGTVTVSDSLGGGGGSCSALPDLYLCDYAPTLAGSGVTLTATGDDGTTGTSAPYTVLPDDVPDRVDVAATGPATAGVPLPVEVRILDAWGNVMDASLQPDPVVSDELGEVDCTPLGTLPDGAAELECTLYTARSDAALTATVAGLQGELAPLEVVNGPLSVVTMSHAGSVVAGAPLTVDFVGEDAFGNPYLVQVDPDVDLADDGGTLAPTLVTLGADGTAQLDLVFTLAGTTTVHASQLGLALGDSAPIDVVAGSDDGLAVTPLSPWAWRDDAVDVRVEAVDAFGNRTDYAGTATLSSRHTASPDVVVSLVNGVAVDQFTWTSTQLDEVLEGSTLDGLTGESDPLHVVRDCGASGPTPALSFGGAPEAVACWDDVLELASISGSFAGSVPGNAALASYVLAMVDGPRQTEAVPTVPLDLPALGVHELVGLVVQTNACAAEIDSTAWVGLDDDTPVGPLTLVTSSPTVGVVGSVTVDLLGVEDCAGDLADGQEVRLRTTMGTLGGTTPTGAGLSVVLDPNGDGSFTLDTLGGVQDGVAEVHAWVPSGAAAGLATVDVVGDNVRPVVHTQTPDGLDLGLVGEVRLGFSEPLLPTQVQPANFDVSGPVATSILTATLEPGDMEVVLTLDPPADGALGAWTVTVFDGIRDAAGNRLAGTWAGSRADYVGSFGDVGGGVVDALDCPVVTPSSLLFRPDGDDGAAEEADQLDIELSSTTAPAWWVIDVLDESGGLVFHDRVVPAGALDTWSWDGRDAAGTIVPNGSYEIRLEPDDGLGNRGAGCAIDVTVDNASGVLP